MQKYIDLFINSEQDEKIIEAYYFDCLIEKKDILEYSKEIQSNAANYLFNLLLSHSISELLKIIEKSTFPEIEITPANIPQYSNINSVDKVVEIVESNPNCDFALVGYFFNKDANRAAQIKYGENHYKTAALLKLVTAKPPFEITELGRAYSKLCNTNKNDIRTRLFLSIPIIRRIVLMAKKEKVCVMKELEKYLSTSTATRRRSNVRTMIDYICESEELGAYIESNIIWK